MIAARRRTLLIGLLLALVATAFRFPRLGTPADVVYDEEFFVPSAIQYLHGLPPKEITHPPLSKLLIAAGVFCFGADPAGWRVPSALAGVALGPLLFLLGRVVLRSERAALLAALLLVLDGQALVQSRLATTNAFSVLFEVAAAYLIATAVLGDELSTSRLMGAAACMGMAFATRWSCIAVLVFLVLALVWARGKRLLHRRELSLLAAAAAVAAGVYVLSYVPWLAQGHSLADLVQLHRDMVHFHRTFDVTHPYASRWYTWPWLVRPSLYYFAPAAPGRPWVAAVLAIGNPAVWWLSVPAVVAVLVAGARRRDPRLLFCPAGFGFAYLWWALASRLQFAHYFLEALPYACLCLGYLLDRAWEGRLRMACWSYLALAIALSLFFYPVQTALPIPAGWFYHRLFGHVYPWRWFPSWY